eukprot:scaffold402400_cov24-Prasinocladus_malaysianus.AAC.1
MFSFDLLGSDTFDRNYSQEMLFVCVMRLDLCRVWRHQLLWSETLEVSRCHFYLTVQGQIRSSSNFALRLRSPNRTKNIHLSLPFCTG